MNLEDVSVPVEAVDDSLVKFYICEDQVVISRFTDSNYSDPWIMTLTQDTYPDDPGAYWQFYITHDYSKQYQASVGLSRHGYCFSRSELTRVANGILGYLDEVRDEESRCHAVIVAQADPGPESGLWIMVLSRSEDFGEEIIWQMAFVRERPKAHSANLCYVFSESELRQMVEGTLKFLEDTKDEA